MYKRPNKFQSFSNIFFKTYRKLFGSEVSGFYAYILPALSARCFSGKITIMSGIFK